MKWPIVCCALFLAGQPAAAPRVDAQEDPVTEKINLVDFSSAGEGTWIIVNDGVMGGVSRSEFRITEKGTGLFTGRLSLEFNGGFASIRTAVDDEDLSKHAGIEMRVRGDGRTYQLRFRTNNRYDGVAYRALFGTDDGQWVTIILPFSEFKPTFRGRILSDVPPLDPAGIEQLGFLLADKKQGPFALEIEFVRTWNGS
jgi:hypothetical protein